LALAMSVDPKGYAPPVSSRRERLSRAHARAVAALRENFRSDLLAGITVMVVLVPQALAYAMLAGVPPVYGLYAATIPPLLYALVGSSRFIAIGPVALTALMIASGLESLAEPGTERWAELAILLSFEVGLLFLVLGLVRAGFVVNFLGHPTVLGFNAAAGLITVGSQLRPFLGIPVEQLPQLSATKPWPILLHLGATHLPTFAVALGSLLALVLMRRYAERWPNYLLVCVAGIVLAWALDLPSHGVPVVGEIPRGLPMPSVPQFELETMISLLPAALSILVIGYASSMTVVKALEAKARGTVKPNRELLAFGAANLASGLFGSFPVSSGLARSTVVAEAGARTRMTGMIAALGVLFALLVAGAVFEWLPRSVLAAIVMLAASSLIDVRGVIEVYKIKQVNGVTAVLTFVAALANGLEVGLAVGIISALVFFVGRTMRPHTAELGRIPGTSVYRNIERFEAAQTCPQAGLLRIDAPLYYANARFLEDRITSIMAAHESMKLLALDFAAVSDMDATAVMSLRRMIEALRAGGSDLHIIGPIGPVRDLFVRSGLLELLGQDHVHRNFAEAGPRLVDAVERSYCEGCCRVSAFPSCRLIPRAALVREQGKAACFMPQI
jgi:SulP family sulfate permease